MCSLGERGSSWVRLVGSVVFDGLLALLGGCDQAVVGSDWLRVLGGKCLSPLYALYAGLFVVLSLCVRFFWDVLWLYL